MKRMLTILFLFQAISYASVAPSQATENTKRTQLVLQITVDGLRKNLLDRYKDQFGEGGFRYLLENGTVYTNAHYFHANTETIAGHATLATGTHPSTHGMIGNVWYDRANGELAYNIEDPNHKMLAPRENINKGAQVDPAQNRSRSDGRSPTSILGLTIGDEISKHFNGQSKIFGVSGKDRSAVAMAGHVGKAFWMSTSTGDYVTSSYYYEAYPAWVSNWNTKQISETYSEKNWALLDDDNSYLLAAQDDRPYETDLKGYGRVFPHAFGNKEDPLFNTRILVSPVGDQLTASFSKSLIVNEAIGQDDNTDYLSVSFSSVDAVNHFFGPSSLENEDIMRQLDRTLADFLSFVDGNIGLDKTLIVFSADHGAPEMPEYMAEKGMHTGRLYSEDILEHVNGFTGQRFGLPNIAKDFFRPYLYLNFDVIDHAGLKREEIAQKIAENLAAIDGINLAVPSTDLSDDTPILAQIKNNTHPDRSGDIYVVQDPYWFLSEKGPVANMHGSPWEYDTHVPIIFVGSNIAPQKIDRRVHPSDVAPTIAAYLNIKMQGPLDGSSLEEVNP